MSWRESPVMARRGVAQVRPGELHRLTQAGKVQLGNMVDPSYTLGAAVLKSYLG